MDARNLRRIRKQSRQVRGEPPGIIAEGVDRRACSQVFGQSFICVGVVREGWKVVLWHLGQVVATPKGDRNAVGSSHLICESGRAIRWLPCWHEVGPDNRRDIDEVSLRLPVPLEYDA